MGKEPLCFSSIDTSLWLLALNGSYALCPGNIHVYTNQGASYSQFYQPRRRRAYERREEVVEENRSQVSESQSTGGAPRRGSTPPCCRKHALRFQSRTLSGEPGRRRLPPLQQPFFTPLSPLLKYLLLWTHAVASEPRERALAAVRRLGAAYVLSNLCPFHLPTEQLHSVPAASARAGANPHISVYSDDGY